MTPQDSLLVLTAIQALPFSLMAGAYALRGDKAMAIANAVAVTLIVVLVSQVLR